MVAEQRETTSAVTRAVVAPYGEPALRALADMVDGVKAGNPLAPVTIVVPSALVGVTVRRGLAERGLAGHRGLVAVDAVALPALAARLGAERLATSDRPPLHP